MHLIVPFLPQIISEKAAQSPPVPWYRRAPRWGWSLREGSQDRDNGAAHPVGSAAGGKKDFGEKRERKSLQRKGKLWAIVWVIGTGADMGCRALQPALERARKFRRCSSSKVRGEMYLT